MIERYYLQKINLHQFLVRKAQRKEPVQEDHIEYPEDTCNDADSINIVQRHLGEKYDLWTCKAVKG